MLNINRSVDFESLISQRCKWIRRLIMINYTKLTIDINSNLTMLYRSVRYYHSICYNFKSISKFNALKWFIDNFEIAGFSAKSFEYLGHNKRALSQVLIGELIPRISPSYNDGEIDVKSNDIELENNDKTIEIENNCANIDDWITKNITNKKGKITIAITYTNRLVHFILLYFWMFL
jgi:hypothetical protein